MKIEQLYAFLPALDAGTRSTITKHFEQGGYQKKDKKILALYRFLAEHHGPFNREVYLAFLKEAGIDENTARTNASRIADVIVDIAHATYAAKDFFFVAQKHLSKAKYLILMQEYELAKSELKKAAKIEKAHHFPDVRRAVKEVEALLVFYEAGIKATTAKVEKIHVAMRTGVADFVRDAKIHELYHGAFNFAMSDPAMKEAWKDLEEKLNDLKPPDQTNPDLYYAYALTQIQIARHKKDGARSFSWCERLYHSFKDDAARRRDYPLVYLSVLDTYLNGLAEHHKFTEMKTIYGTLERMNFHLPKLRTKLNSLLLFHHLNIACYDLKIIRGHTAQSTEKLLVQFEEQEPKMLAQRGFATTLLCSIFFLLRFDYARAEEFLDRLVTHRSNKLRKDYQCLVLVLQTLIKMEDERSGYDFLDSTITNVYNRLVKWRGGLTPEESITITFFRNWNQSPDSRAELVPIFWDCREKFKSCKNTQGFLTTHAHVFTQWLTLKIEDKTWR